MPELSVIIASFDAEATIERCLNALAAQSDSGFETIVVDSSTDRTPDIVAALFPGSRLIRSAQRLAPGGARNRGVQAARGDIFAFIDADCVAAPDWIARIRTAHQSGHAIVGGSIGNANPENAAGWVPFLCEFTPWLAARPPSVMSDIPTCCLSVKRWAYHRFGPFPEEGYCSDTAFNWRAGRAGHPPRFDPEIRVEHINLSSHSRIMAKLRMHGRAFARMRCREQRLSAGATAFYLVGSPALPVLLFARRVRQVWPMADYRRAFLRVAFGIFWGLVQWSWGEGYGYAEALASRFRKA